MDASRKNINSNAKQLQILNRFKIKVASRIDNGEVPTNVQIVSALLILGENHIEEVARLVDSGTDDSDD